MRHFAASGSVPPSAKQLFQRGAKKMDSHSRSTEFLDAFASIEKHLRKISQSSKDTSIPQMIASLKREKSFSEIRAVENDLRELADLRNAIVHERGEGAILAVPNETAVDLIKSTLKRIAQPAKIFPYFRRQGIETFLATQAIGDLVESIYQNSYSQFPIYDNKGFVDLLTSNTVARWLGSVAKNDLVSLNDTTIEQVLECTENRDHVKFMSRECSVFEAIELFNDHEGKGTRLEAILISQNGIESEKIIGMIAYSDMPQLIELSK